MASDPRSGVWAMKCYKTTHVYVDGLNKVQSMKLQDPVKAKSSSTGPKAGFYIKPLKWSESNRDNNFQRFARSQRVTSTEVILA